MRSRVPTTWSHMAIVSPSLTWQSPQVGRTPVGVVQCTDSRSSGRPIVPVERGAQPPVALGRIPRSDKSLTEIEKVSHSYAYFVIHPENSGYRTDCQWER
jgi:hypothetical protein